MKRGFLLMNTGSPDAPTEEAVRTYLKKFLMDPFVIDLPRPLRYVIVHWAILPKRPATSAKAYQSIWTENGSPLVHHCTQLAKELNIELGMAYGKPSFKTAVENLLSKGVDEICLLPLFPQYANATTGSCVSGVKKVIHGRAKLRIAPPFYNDPAYTQPLADTLKKTDEHILFSYHGLPLRQLKKQPAPDYRIQCMETTKAIADAAGLSKDRYSTSFQSRLGRAKWIKPYTEETLQQLPTLGKTKLAVICPSFFCDCLETLEEIEIKGRKIFVDAGGESFRMIPCLNDSPAAFQCLESLMAHAENWPTIQDSGMMIR